MRVLAAVALALGACTGTTGTITLDLATAPDSHLLDAVQRLRLTITDPHQVVETTRTAAGFDLALDVDATATNGALIVEGFDTSGALIACGQSPRFPVAAINAHVVVYMAAPWSIAASPAKFSARSQVAAAPISLGAVLAGGIELTDAIALSSATAVYNAFDHSLVGGIPLPAPRYGLAMAAAAAGGVYMFGGIGPGGQPTGTLWRFDTTVAPSGAFATITEQAGYARTGALIVPVGAEHYLITGTPALELDAGMLTARGDVTGLPAAAAGVVPGDGTPTAVFAGSAVVRFRGTVFATLSSDHPVDGAVAVTLPDGRVAVIGGTGSRSVLAVAPAAGTVTVVPDVLSTARMNPAVAVTSRHVVVAGGDLAPGAQTSTADVLDARTLALVVTVPMRTRIGGFAVALPNDQVLLGGGDPALYELFTPAPPP